VGTDRHRFRVLATSVDLAINVIFARQWYVVTNVRPYRGRASRHYNVVDFYAQHYLKRATVTEGSFCSGDGFMTNGIF
jgi:hypothetical protein